MSSEEDVEVTRSEQNELMQHLLDEGIKPHTEALVKAWNQGEVAVVFFEVGPDADTEETAHQFGWRGGQSECATLNRTRAEAFASGLSASDPASTWLRGGGGTQGGQRTDDDA